MSGRQDPLPDWADYLKDDMLARVENWLTRDWLQKSELHPVRDVWKRRDFIATTELLYFGSLLDNMERSIPAASLSEIMDRVKSEALGDRSGALFELTAGAMMVSPGCSVSFPPVGNPGFDLVLHLKGNKQVRVSCKVLNASTHAIEFSRFSTELQTDLVKELNGSGPAFQLLGGPLQGTARTYPDTCDVARHLAGHVRSWNGQSKTETEYLDWFFGFLGMEQAPDGFTWSRLPDTVSHTVVLTAEFSEHEQKRFNDRMQTACANMSRHSLELGSLAANLIMVKVPVSISMAAASSWLEVYFAQGRWKNVSGAILYRPSMVYDTDRRDTVLGHELAVVKNPGASTLPSSFWEEICTLSVHFPVGVILSGEPRTELRVGDDSANIEGSYMFVRGHHIFETVYAGHTHFPTLRRPGISTTLIVRNLQGKDMALNFIYPPNDELVLL